MRSAKYDSLMQTLLQTELKRIPRWLRITRLKLVIAFIAELALAAVIILSLNPGEIATGTIFANFRYWYWTPITMTDRHTDWLFPFPTE